MDLEEEEGLAVLSDEVRAAREALLNAARSEPGRWWTTDELEAVAHYHATSQVLMIALYELVSQHVLDLDQRFRVRVAA